MSQQGPTRGSETVKTLLRPEAVRSDEMKRAKELRKLPLDSRAVSDVFMLAMGAYTPLDGFMGHDDWRGSCQAMKLTSGVFWPLPIQHPESRALADSIHHAEERAPVNQQPGEVLAVTPVS